MAPYKIESAKERLQRGAQKGVPDFSGLPHLSGAHFVKAVFKQSGCPDERMWVRVDKHAGGKITGTLANYPVCIDARYGEGVAFHESDIVDVEMDPSAFLGTDTAKVVTALTVVAALGFLGWFVYRTARPMPALVAPPVQPTSSTFSSNA